MNRKTIKIIIIAVVLLTLTSAGIGAYFYFTHGTKSSGFKIGQYYHLTSIRPTERFAGATMNNASYFRVRKDKKFGDLYLYGLSATDAPIPFIVTSFKETDKRTIIEFEFIIGEGEATKLQHLSATCTDKEIRIKAVEEHKVDIIQQKYNDIDSLKYEVTILVFGLNTEDK